MLGLGLLCSPDVGPRDLWLFPKLRGCHYETIEEMKEAVTRVIDTLTQEDFGGAFQKLLERYNKCIATGGESFEGDLSFMSVLSIKFPYEKSLESYRMHLVFLNQFPEITGLNEAKFLSLFISLYNLLSPTRVLSKTVTLAFTFTSESPAPFLILHATTQN